MKTIDLDAMTAKQLLSLYADLLNTLKSKGITRSTNNPLADYAENLVAGGLNLSLARKSNAGYDAIDESSGLRYEVKARRITSHNRSRQLGALRNLESKPFDFLVAVLFNEDFSILRAAQIPLETVTDLADFVGHTNSYKLILRDSVFDDERVKDITPEIAGRTSTNI